MISRFKHIVRSITITFLLTGLLAHLFVPFTSHAQKAAFTRWLDHNVVESGNESEIELRKTIQKLPKESTNFWILVEEATELVAAHQDHFKIHLSDHGASKTQPTTNRLIDQWNMFQDQKSDFNSVLVESVKVFSNWIPQHADFSSVFGNSERQNLTHQTRVFYHSAVILGNSITPLISGISINAP